jgi:predicted nucleic acid-binding Zn ribbon protein
VANINKANIWKFSFFRSVGNLFKSSPRTQRCYVFSEEGIIRKVDLPMATGWATDTTNKLSWAVIHKLKVQIKTKEGPEEALFICDRTYIPLDPAHILNSEDQKRLIPLKEIAASKYNQAESTCQERTKVFNAHRLLNTMLYFSFIFTAIIVLIVLMKGKVH